WAEADLRTGRAGSVTFENRGVNQIRSRSVEGVVPLKNEKSGVVAGVNGLGNVETAGIEIVKSARIKCRIDPGQINICSNQRAVGSGSEAGSIGHWTIHRSVPIRAHVVSGGRGIARSEE